MILLRKSSAYVSTWDHWPSQSKLEEWNNSEYTDAGDVSSISAFSQLPHIEWTFSYYMKRHVEFYQLLEHNYHLRAKYAR